MERYDLATILVQLAFGFLTWVSLVATWRSGNGIGRINEVTLHWAQLVLGWVTQANSASYP